MERDNKSSFVKFGTYRAWAKRGAFFHIIFWSAILVTLTIMLYSSILRGDQFLDEKNGYKTLDKDREVENMKKGRLSLGPFVFDIVLRPLWSSQGRNAKENEDAPPRTCPESANRTMDKNSALCNISNTRAEIDEICRSYFNQSTTSTLCASSTFDEISKICAETEKSSNTSFLELSKLVSKTWTFCEGSTHFEINYVCGQRNSSLCEWANATCDEIAPENRTREGCRQVPLADIRDICADYTGCPSLNNSSKKMEDSGDCPSCNYKVDSLGNFSIVSLILTFGFLFVAVLAFYGIGNRRVGLMTFWITFLCGEILAEVIGSFVCFLILHQFNIYALLLILLNVGLNIFIVHVTLKYRMEVKSSYKSN